MNRHQLVMHEQELRKSDAQYPMGDQEPLATRRHRTAAGFHAIYETLFHALRNSPLHALRSLTVLNQKGGFQCPSCAWPEPDGARHAAEFCENGAKAIAWETTSKLVGPEFF